MLTYLATLFDWLSCGVNAAVLLGRNDESVSGRSYRESVYELKRRWVPLRKLIDGVFWVVERDHCRKSYYKDLERANYYRLRHEMYMTTDQGRFEEIYHKMDRKI